MSFIDFTSCGDILDVWPSSIKAAPWEQTLGQDWPAEEVSLAASQWALHGAHTLQHASWAGALLTPDDATPVMALAALARVAHESMEQSMWCVRMHQWLMPSLDHIPSSSVSYVGVSSLGRLAALCMHKTLGAPTFTAVETVSTHAMAQRVASVLAKGHARHATLLWEALGQVWARSDERARQRCERELCTLLGSLELHHHGSAEALDVLAEQEVELWADSPSLGHLLPLEFAAMFYHTLEQDIFPGLKGLGLDPYALWAKRNVVHEATEETP